MCRTLLLSAGMLRRAKYSRLRNDSLASLEDRPQRILALKRDLCVDSDFALLDQGTADHHEGSGLSSFTPRMGSATPHGGLRGHTARDQTARGDHKETGSTEPLSGGPSALSGTKRPISLHRMSSLHSKLGCPCSRPRDGPCCPETPAGDRPSGSVHHNMKVPVATGLVAWVGREAHTRVSSRHAATLGSVRPSPPPQMKLSV